MDHRILVIDDEQDFLDSVRRGLLTSGFRRITEETDPMRAATRITRGEEFDIALVDLTMPRMNGIELLELIKRTSPNTECIMVTAADEARIAVECLKKGAYDYLTKPLSKDELILTINHAIERKRLLDILSLGKETRLPRSINRAAFGAIITRSPRMLKLLTEAELHARSDVPVLITGESGTGKELLARAIHLASHRARNVYTPVNMAALTGTLFNSEFFGHTRGAFTGADKERAGYLEHTHGGTLFLDEIGNLPSELQGNLLRVLQEGEYIRVGDNRPRKTDVRFVIATNANIEQMLTKGTFRKDLYYRLKGAWLHLPPLRERREDIPPLAENFLKSLRGTTEIPGIEEETLAVLMEYDFPGNIRELKSILQSAVNLAQGRPLSVNCLPEYLPRRKAAARKKATEMSGEVASLAEIEKDHILQAYESTGRNKTHTSELLGIGLNTLRRKLRAYGVE